MRMYAACLSEMHLLLDFPSCRSLPRDSDGVVRAHPPVHYRSCSGRPLACGEHSYILRWREPRVGYQASSGEYAALRRNRPSAHLLADCVVSASRVLIGRTERESIRLFFEILVSSVLF